ncbi:WD40/YVTN/BNR-like repeat-containing protein [Leeia aquatica]|uniref:Photosynthesis system II assembly factor Ycf48/Hcf136-like domain-containing protein n=1 Tax=Leeia aquatica TaxID=2725557 RepID=A0A847SI27_9NEIS|nr:hypothetical protein [Leeia aquatica]NLR76819.1 hypothetical protein [Leeia aquatica]
MANKPTPIHAAALMEGVYEVETIGARLGCINMLVCKGYDVLIDDKSFRFSIEPGKLTDLGMIVVGLPDEADRVLATHQVAKGIKSESYLRELVPGLTSAINGKALSWSDPALEGRGVALAKIKRDDFLLGNLKHLNDSNYLAVGPDVVYKVNINNGRVNVIDVGAGAPLDTILPVSDRVWLAGGFGELVQTDDAGASWHSVLENLPLGFVVDLKKWKENLIVTLLRNGNVEIYGKPISSGKWELWASYLGKPDNLDGTGLAWIDPISFIIEDKLVTTVPGAEMAILDILSRKSRVYPLPGKALQFSVSGDGRLRCQCMPWVIINQYESMDIGGTWQGSSYSHLMNIPFFKDKMHGVGYEKGIMFRGKLKYTEDGGLTWKESQQPEFTANEIFYNSANNSFYATTPYHGYLIKSSDDGKTWSTVAIHAQ